jgi:hypothetical protein
VEQAEFERRLEADNKAILEQKKETSAYIDKTIEKLAKENELFRAYVSGDQSPEALAAGARQAEKDRQYVIDVYNLPSDTPYEIAQRVLVENTLCRLGQISKDLWKIRVYEIVNDYRKTRGLPPLNEDEDYPTEHSIKHSIDYNLKLLARHMITKKQFDEEKEVEFESRKRFGIITTKEQEEKLRIWLDNYLNKNLEEVK